MFVENITLQQLLSNAMCQRNDTWFRVSLRFLDKACQIQAIFSDQSKGRSG